MPQRRPSVLPESHRQDVRRAHQEMLHDSRRYLDGLRIHRLELVSRFLRAADGALLFSSDYPLA